MSASSGITPPDSQYGTCAICHGPTEWCGAGYWAHAGPDILRDHGAVTDPAPSSSERDG